MNDSGSSDVRVWVYDRDNPSNGAWRNKRKHLLKYGGDPRWVIDESRGEQPIVAPQPEQPEDPNWAANALGRAVPFYDKFSAAALAATDPILGRSEEPTFGGRYAARLAQLEALRADAESKRPLASLVLQAPLAAGLAKGLGAFEPAAGSLLARLVSPPAVKQGLLSSMHAAGEDTSGHPDEALARAAVAYPTGNLLGAMAAPNPEPSFQRVLRSPTGYVPVGSGKGVSSISDLANPNALRMSGANLRYRSLNPIYSQTHAVEKSFPGGREGLGFYINRMRGAGEEPLVSGLRTSVDDMAEQAPAIAERASADTGRFVEAADAVPGAKFPAAPFFAAAEREIGAPNLPHGAPPGMAKELRRILEAERKWADPAIRSQEVDFYPTPGKWQSVPVSRVGGPKPVPMPMAPELPAPETRALPAPRTALAERPETGLGRVGKLYPGMPEEPPTPGAPAVSVEPPPEEMPLPTVEVRTPEGPVRAHPGPVRSIREGYVPLRTGTALVKDLRETSKLYPEDSPVQDVLHRWQSTAKDVNEWAIEQALGPQAAADYRATKLRQQAANRLLEIAGRTTERQAGHAVGGIRGPMLGGSAPTLLNLPERGLRAQISGWIMNNIAPGEAFILDRTGTALAGEPGAGWVANTAAVPGRLLGVGGSAPYVPFGYEIPQALPVAKSALPMESDAILRAAAAKRQQLEDENAALRKRYAK